MLVPGGVTFKSQVAKNVLVYFSKGVSLLPWIWAVKLISFSLTQHQHGSGVDFKFTIMWMWEVQRCWNAVTGTDLHSCSDAVVSTVLCRLTICTYLAVFLVLAPHLFAETSRCLTRSVWGYDVVGDHSWQVCPHRGQVSTVCKPWWTSETHAQVH